jgi:hypothetical protein
MKIRPVAAELFHAKGRIDRHNEANNRLADAPKSSYVHPRLRSYSTGQSIPYFCGTHISSAVFTYIRI